MQPAGFTLAAPLLLSLLLLVPLGWLLTRSRLRAVPPGQRRAILTTRSIMVALLALALAEPVLTLRAPSLHIAFAVDHSASLTPEQQGWINDWVQQAVSTLKPDDRWTVLEFGQRTALPGSPDDVIGPERTNLAAAIQSASSILPHTAARHVVLLTDGWETQGHALATEALNDGTSLSYVAAPIAAGPDVALRALEAPSHTRLGEPIDLVLTIDSLEETSGRLRIWLDDRLTGEQDVALGQGATRLSVAPIGRAPGFHTIRAEIALDGDPRPDNNVALATTVVTEPGRVLVVEERAGEGAEIANLLEDAGIAVTSKPTAEIPTSPAWLREYDAVVLANVPATSLSLDQQRTLQLNVQELGRGLVAAGGLRSFAPGGYEGALLEEMLPVSSAPPVRRRQGSVALVLVVDKSGSMDLYRTDVSKIAMAREAAIQATELLQADDVLGVLAFDSRNQWVVPVTRMKTADDLRQAQARIAAIQADGGTSIYPALEAAYDAIKDVDARLKHIVLLTDGQSFNADYSGLIQRMRPHQVTLSSVAIGSDSDTRLLTLLANIGEGRYYFTERSAEIPRIASKEANILTRDAIVEGQITALLAEPSPIMRGISSQLPDLTGYVATTPRSRALTALSTDRGDPLLAHWQYGLGRVVAWTSDIHGTWTDAWLDSSEAARVWAQAVRWSMPEPQRPDLRVSTSVEGQMVTLQAESVRDDGTFGDLLDTRATVVMPDGRAIEARLPQRAPGVYSLTTEAAQPGVYRALFTQTEPDGTTREEIAGFVVSPDVETRFVGVNQTLLNQLAARTGGRQLREPDEVGRLSRATTERDLPLWPWLAGAALAILPLDVALRRLRWPWFRRGPEHR